VKILGADLILLPRKHVARISLILATGILLGVFVWRQSSQRDESQAENLAFLHSVRADSIAGVSISDDHGKPLKTVTEPDALASFASAVNSTELYQPNHPYATSKFQVALRPKDGPMHRFDLYTLFPADGTIYMDFYPGGNGKSTQLFGWMKAQGFVQ
jgi:hypothetical protein